MWPLRANFWPLEVDFLPACGRRILTLVVDLIPLGVDFSFLVVNCGTLGVLIRSIEVDFRRLGANFRLLVVDLGSKIDFRPL